MIWSQKLDQGRPVIIQADSDFSKEELGEAIMTNFWPMLALRTLQIQKQQ